MKRYMTRVVVLFFAGMLISCGGGGDGDSGSGGGGSPQTPVGGDPGNGPGGAPVNDNDPTLPSAGARVEESDAAVKLSDGWTQSESRWGWSGGAAMQSTVAGATASIKFTGTSIRWIGSRNRRGGIALVRIDGGPPIEVDLFSRPNEVRTSVLTLNDLGEGTHTLTIEVTGRQHEDAQSNVVVVDAFEVQPQILSHLQESDPDVSYSGTWVHNDSSDFSGGGVHTPSDPAFGGARYTETAGAKVTLKFRGTSISWSGYRGPDAGIARVQVDGGQPTPVDTYSRSRKYQETLFTLTGLADTTHTLTIEATGEKNSASTGAKIVVDAFDVTTPGKRYQQDHQRDPAIKDSPSITYSGYWQRSNSRPWSEGASFTSPVAGSRVTFSFTGTSVSWIGCQKASCGGRARIFIDGAFVKEVSNGRPEPIEGFQHTIFRADGLSNGPHTLTLEVLTDGPYIVVDAFDVHP